MKRLLVQSKAFERAAKRFLARNPESAGNLRIALECLTADAFHPSLKTHKLKGKLKSSWACSAGYDLRIVFSFVRHKGSETILLEAVGSHDEVY